LWDETIANVIKYMRMTEGIPFNFVEKQALHTMPVAPEKLTLLIA
jgi:hypothetical protein